MDLVRECMSSPAVVVASGARVSEIDALLAARSISAVPVVDGDRLVGIVSTTDLVGLAAAASRESGDEPAARDCMTSPVVTAREGDALDVASRRMVAARVHRLVVVDDAERPRGVLSARDALEVLRRRRVALPIETFMQPEVASVDIGDPIALAVERLAQARVHGLVVTDLGKPVGVFTHAEALASKRLPPSLREGPVEEVMSYETVCLDASTPVFRAAGYAAAMNVRRVLAVRDRRLAGILSVIDLVDALTRPA
jgi:CBS domain-containing protein